MFNNAVTQTYTNQDATLEILVMLLGALLLGFLLGWIVNKLINNNYSNEEVANEKLSSFVNVHENDSHVPVTKTVESAENNKSIHNHQDTKNAQKTNIYSQPYAEPKIDDLKKISGINSSVERRLKDSGLKSFTDLRDVSRQTLIESLDLSKEDALSKDAQFWPHQASLAAKGEWRKLSDYQTFLKRTLDKTNATQQKDSNTHHDDLTKIEGIGPKIEEILNSNKITTYTDLMESDRDTLKSFLNDEGSRFEKNEPETWPLQAGMANRGEWEELKIYQEFMEDDSTFFTDDSDSSSSEKNTHLNQTKSSVADDENTNKVSSIQAETDLEEVQTEPQPKIDFKDDLKKIDGIGPKIQEILNSKGIYTYSDLRKSNKDTLKSYLDDAGSQFKLHETDSWPKQAGFAEKGKWRELAEYQDFMQGVREASSMEMEAESQTEQPLPVQSITSHMSDDEADQVSPNKDDLKKIEGIGPKIEELLQKAGIDTFEKLQDCNSATIKDLLDTAGPQFRMHNPDTWPHQAKMAFEGEWEKLEEYQEFLLGGRE